MPSIEDFGQLLQDITVWLDKISFARLLTAIIILILSRWLARLARYWVNRALRHLNLSTSLKAFLREATYYGVILLAIFVAMIVLGVPTSSIITLVAVIIIILVVILQPSVRNLSAGAFFIFYQPFKVGDLIKTAGVLGYVQEFNLNYSILHTLDNKIVTIPNSQVELTNIVNYSTLDILRVDMEFYITYNDDFLKAKQLLREIVTNDSRILKDPPTRILVLDLDNRGVKIGVWPYVKGSDYLEVLWDTPEQVKLAFDQAGITIPVLQHEIYLDQLSNKRVISSDSSNEVRSI